MYRKTSVLLTALLLGCLFTNTPVVAKAEVLVAQVNNPELKNLIDQGKRLVDAQDYHGAIAVYQQAAKLDPKNDRIFAGIGYLYTQQGNFTSALDAYRRAIAINPNNSDFYYAVGYLKSSTKDNKGAKEAYRRAIQLNRNNVNAYLGLGVAQTSLGDYQAAMWAYEQAINLDKNNPRTYELIGAMFKQRRQTTQANKVLRKALDLYQRGNDQEGVARIQTMLQEIGG
ncbi:tetratricopeptide repeat protein [Dolichospermum sp. LEGE 00240]|uniref:tetratricopeptide repeat protein n=1 Tax=Dolichospermum sp. LEGE 00240 TaxID=1828603 RepID=UPI00187F0561|nr:tetratricopeptide repeat protein [Dolichospermum sp. LEGE 00240]MBE9249288.1 tetratricopeptide repeat protein [Dolichospermum sp. LEGE 00240]